MFSRSLRGLIGSAAVAIAIYSPLPAVQAETTANQLTRSEELSGWKLLFDGKSTEGWRGYKKDKVSEAWKVVEGALVRDGQNAGDIITTEKYKYFELMLEYKISEEGNSGLMFHVNENNGAPWQSGPEIQIQDNVKGHDPQKSGWLYQLYQPGNVRSEKGSEPLDATRPAGQWNQLYLRIAPNQCEVSMNGEVYYYFQVGNDDWKNRVAKSKFKDMPEFGNQGEGYICLQDHGNLVSFRNIKVRRLSGTSESPVKQPIDGKLSLKGVPAFPDLQWEGWLPVEEDGTVNKPLRILELTYAKGDENRLYAMDQKGRIFTFENSPKAKEAKLFLDIQKKVSFWAGPGANEQGLLGLAFHPKFHENGEFFVNYTRQDNDKTVVSRFRVKADNKREADPNSEEVLLEVEQPFKNHNGGAIEFGPDGFLYIAFGDGGFKNDPKQSGQDRKQLLGKILRIDVDKKSDGKPYGIPADNPFVGQSEFRGEIFAYGFRNPWRISFDKESGRLWVADVGQDLYEEIDIVTKGGNYGWSRWEGTHPFGNRKKVDGVSEPIDPVWEYDHQIGKSITGGRVVQSVRLPSLKGKYLYADYVSGALWALTYDASTGKSVRNEQIIAGGTPIMAFGEDANGEVYYSVDTNRSQCLFKLEASE